MGKYLNDDKNVRIERFINAEYKVAVEKFYLAKKALLDWSKDTDSIIYKLCSECSSKLYDAVEHFLREYINNPAETDKIMTIVNLCEKIKNNEDLKNIELSVFVTRKEPRNDSTHYGRLSELGDYYRVLFNLRKLILLVDPDADIPIIEEYSETFDFNKFIYDVEEFTAENCHYVLIADPLNDVNNEILQKFLSLSWSIVIDFDGKNLNGKLYNSLPNISDVQTCILDNVKNQGLSEATFKLKKIVYLAVEASVAPRKASKWNGVDKSNFEFFINKSKTVGKNKVIIVLAKQLDASANIFIEKILDVYGNENVKILFLEGLFSTYEKEDLEERYSDYSEYEISSVILSIEAISKNTNIFTPVAYTGTSGR